MSKLGANQRRRRSSAGDSGSRPEAGGIPGRNEGQSEVAGTSTELGGSMARDGGVRSEICAQKLAGEEGSSAATTSRDRPRNPILMGREAREEEN